MGFGKLDLLDGLGEGFLSGFAIIVRFWRMADRRVWPLLTLAV
jgi:hypothetical protein